MGITSENIAKRFQISRLDQDKFSFESHLKATKARKNGIYMYLYMYKLCLYLFELLYMYLHFSKSMNYLEVHLVYLFTCPYDMYAYYVSKNQIK